MPMSRSTARPVSLPGVRVVGAHVRAAAREARAGLRAEAGALAFGLALGLGLRGLGRLVGLRLVDPEDVLLGGAVEKLHELLRVDGLALEQDLRDPVELIAVLLEDALG